MGELEAILTMQTFNILLLLSSIVDIGISKHFLIETADTAEDVGEDYTNHKTYDSTLPPETNNIPKLVRRDCKEDEFKKVEDWDCKCMDGKWMRCDSRQNHTESDEGKAILNCPPPKILLNLIFWLTAENPLKFWLLSPNN